ncbi:MAG: phosphatase PAP2 family protein [Acidobacteriota bacterium]|nr:phosphatase PAP2 family protein [Acidobacteriota bacterium]
MDSILFWNAVALEANRVSHSDPAKGEQTGPPLSSRALAIVHLAMYDAYAAITGGAGFPRYLTAPATVPLPPPSPPGLLVANAVAGAAHKTLSELYKAQRGYFDDQLSSFDTADPYFAFGAAVGDALLMFRAADPGVGDNGYMAHTGKYRHRADPDNSGQGYHAPFYGAQSKGFAVSVRHKLAAPPSGPGNAKYLEAFNQVRAKGIAPELTGTLPDPLFADRRTPDETVIGIYWGYDGANRLGTPPRLYNQIIRLVAEKQDNTEGDNARLFAFVNAAMADAGIFAWEQKYCHDFWRPILGVREQSESFGPGATEGEDSISAEADPFWLPLGAPNTNNTALKNFTPPFPAYPSGHATFGAAAFHITRLFYGVPSGDTSADNLFDELEFVSEELNGVNRDNRGVVRPRHVRKFTDGLWQMILENGLSRIYLGVHWIFDAFATHGDGSPDFTQNIGGVPLGLKIAEDIFKTGDEKAPKMTQSTSHSDPLDQPPVIKQPADVSGCADKHEAMTKTKAKGKKAKDEATTDDKQKVETPFLSGTSRR